LPILAGSWEVLGTGLAGVARWPLAIATIEQTSAGTKNMPTLIAPDRRPTPRRLVLTTLAARRARAGDSKPIRVRRHRDREDDQNVSPSL
jgi:hypothetical protein